MFKKLFCNHKYKYYHTSSYVPFLLTNSYSKWHYICKDCSKTTIIYELDLNNLSESISKKVAKEKIMGVDNSKHEELEFPLGRYTFFGKKAFYLKEIYKNYHQEHALSKY